MPISDINCDARSYPTEDLLLCLCHLMASNRVVGVMQYEEHALPKAAGSA